ncbi:MAG TPA: cellulase family glycosylhydrolase [Solirubrobacteraceae bacterium]|nr:cellulase family glycosylhydrolase [Solirubrobacteraceae bacterium]
MGRLLPAVAGIACAIAGSAFVPAVGQAATVPLSISIQGNHFVNGAGQTIRLLGVNHPSSEYACVDGFGYNDGHQDAADAAAVASWDANAVRVPLNEDCWLGINGQPNDNEGPPQPLTAAGYRQAVQDYVSALNAHGVYAILDLHWTAPGAQVAMEQQPMPDAHSTDFWNSVASTFKSNPAVVFDVFNEPYDPTDPRSGDDGNASDAVTWGCWASGTKPDVVGGGAPPVPCDTQAYDANGNPTTRYQIVGMQTLVDTIRATGAAQPIMVGGLDYANDLTQWADHAPNDPLNQEAASFHNYMGKACDTAACWNSQIAPIAANVPVVTGEFDEDNYTEPKCATQTPSTFDSDYMTWADQHGVGYLAWGWWVLSQDEKDSAGCSAFYLLNSYDGTPAAPNGTALHDHLISLAGAGAGTSPGGPTGPTKITKAAVKLKAFRVSVKPGGSKVAFTLRSAQSATGTLTGQTVSRYAVSAAKIKRHTVSLGSVRFSLKAGKAKTVVLKLSKASRKLLAAHHRLKVQITLTLAGASTRRTVIRRTVTLKAPRAR